MPRQNSLGEKGIAVAGDQNLLRWGTDRCGRRAELAEVGKESSLRQNSLRRENSAEVEEQALLRRGQQALLRRADRTEAEGADMEQKKVELSASDKAKLAKMILLAALERARRSRPDVKPLTEEQKQKIRALRQKIEAQTKPAKKPRVNESIYASVRKDKGVFH